MNLTTVARIQTVLEKSLADQDTLIAQIIAWVSAGAEAEMGRHAETVARTEYYDAAHHQTSIMARGFGDALTVTSIHNDPTWVYGSSTLVDSSDYAIDAETGVIYLKNSLSVGPRAIKLVYTGGMGTSDTDFVANYPDIAGAVDMQCVFYMRRSQTPDAAAWSDLSGNINFTSPIAWLPGVRSTLGSHRSIGMLA